MNQKMTEDLGKLQKKFDDHATLQKQLNGKLQKHLDGKLQKQADDLSKTMTEEFQKQHDDHNTKLQAQVDDLSKKMSEDNTKLQGQVDDLGKKMIEDNTKLQAQVDDLSKKMNEDNTKLQGQVDDLGKKMSKMCEMQTGMMTKVTQMMTEMKQLKEMSFGHIIIAGGWNGKANISSVEIFSWSQKAWALIKPMSTAHTSASAVTYKGEVLISGGHDGKKSKDKIETSSCEQSAEWKISRVKLPEVRVGHATVVYKDSLILSGGRAGIGGGVSDKIYEVSMVPPYSTKVLTTMPEPRYDHTMELFEDKLSIFGGCHGGTKDTVMMYDLVTNKWKMMKPLPFPVAVMASVLWQNNAILLGGRIGADDAMDSVVMYNLTTRQSKYLPSMKHKRRGCAAVVSGDVLVVMGGYDGRNNLKSVEVFHFLKKVWEELPEMNEARHHASAVVKPN